MPKGRRTFFGPVSALEGTQASTAAGREIKSELLQAIEEIPLVNSHEHIIPE